MDPISLAAFGGGLFNNILSSGARKQENALRQASLNLQRQQAADNKELATATRTDAQGNRLVYRPGIGFVQENTATTQGIIDGQQTEQLQSLREDAPRNRQSAIRQDERSKEADDYFKELFNTERYRRKPSEQENEAEALLDNLAVRKENEGGRELQPFINDAIRSDDGSNLRRAVSLNDANQPSFAEIVKASKQEGRNNVVTDDQITGGNLSEIGAVGQIASSGGSSPIAFGNDAGQLDARSDAALNNLLQTLQQGTNATSRGLEGLAGSQGSDSNFGELFALLAKGSGVGQQNQSVADFWKTGRQATVNQALRGI